MKKRETKSVAIDDRTLVLVPLGRDAKQDAHIWQDDLEFLLKLGLSPNWLRQPNGYVTATCHGASGNHVAVGRVLLDAGPGTVVRYRDSNPLNLRRENLELVKHKGGMRRDRDYLKPKLKDIA